ncbi:molybdopterin-dependent oxidoreductase [Alicyclobacillus tolerans]|uniref:molybdopterin-dependent oxidoreductase n=1 Tax=Alicyclobacillus tolerans TaxID=90970 RepID=UPI001F453253|nr:molybdopterin-dependent oxidoreductase [Alicyclobacillus tolerans]MCF8563915.1 molybdopterin-dependent oxidoreductase [Alicyclobacillus tolerans]
MSLKEDRLKQVKGFNGLNSSPDPDKWDDWKELDPTVWPRKQYKNYELIPTVCFNCEAACGLLSYIDKETGEIRKLEGHPLHPASRGRNCAKGPATVTQLTNPDRILYPLKRVGERGGGQWEQVSWDDALSDIAARIRKSFLEGRRDEVTYHVGRPGEDEYTERVLKAWGIDGLSSHTNVCSAGARTGYAFWMGIDRPSPDYANARFILMMSAHLESGHYFNPNAQRIIEAQQRGTKVAVIDTRLSNTASKADYWLSPWPGTESSLLLAIANELIQTERFNLEFVRKWTNWREFLADRDYLNQLKDRGFVRNIPQTRTFQDFVYLLKQIYSSYTFEWAEDESGVSADLLRQIADEVARAGTAFASNIWRNAAAGHLGGWMITRSLMFLNVLMGAVGEPGSTLPNTWAKFVPARNTSPDPIQVWNENHNPREYPLSYFELSFALPHILRKRQKRLEVYFTRVVNPIWTFPDGFSWMEMLRDKDKVGLHVALTPTWSETAEFADYVLPMGLAPERHDLHSYETHASQWIGFRQPVKRVFMERHGENIHDTRDANPGSVWEENEFWIELSWRIDPDGSLGIRKHFESPYRPGERITVLEYYRWIFENSVPGLPEAAAAEGLSPLEYMQRFGAFEVTQAKDVYNFHKKRVDPELLAKAKVVEEEDSDSAMPGVWVDKLGHKVNHRPYPGPFKNEEGKLRAGISVDGDIVEGFPTPSGKLEFFSTTLRDWGWPEYAIPIYPRDEAERRQMPHVVSQVHHKTIDYANNEFILLPTFRLPQLIHSRTNGAKWLHEIAHTNPVWINPVDAKRLGVETGDEIKVETEIGYFVDKVWVTEGIRPGVVACSHHLGRWRLYEDRGADRWNSSLVKIHDKVPGKWEMKVVHGPAPFQSQDKDSSRIWWSDGGVHQNLIFPVQPDPVSGAHAWHQRVHLNKAKPGERYGEVHVDTEKAYQVFQRWLSITRPAPGPGGLYRPYWMLRVLKPHPDAYVVPDAVPAKPVRVPDRG